MNVFDAIKAALGEEAEAKQTPQQTVFIGMHMTGKHIYAGTVPAHVIERRRRANKRARLARRGRPQTLGMSSAQRDRRIRRHNQVAVRSQWANR